MLVAAGLLATAGAGDAAWRLLHGPSATTQRLLAAGDPAATGAVPGPRLPGGLAMPSPTRFPATSALTPTPTPHATETAVGHAAHRGSGDGDHDRDDPRGRRGGTARTPKVEPVTLPPPRVAVRTRPAYYVHDLLPDAPPRALALTVDDGPDPEWTPKVLRLLDRFGVQATFCMVGLHVAAYPNLARDVHRAGHAIVNHSWSHPLPFALLPERQIVAQITDTQRAIERAAKVTPQLFRAPGGEWSPFVYRAIAAYGLQPLDWDVDPVDWAAPGTRRIARRMLHARPNDIVLCHDGGGNRRETVNALRTVLPTWKRRNLDLVTLLLPGESSPPSPSPRSSPSASPTLTPSATPTP